jgi:hypothetical protein
MGELMTKVLKMVCLTASIMIFSMILIPGSILAWGSDFDLDVRPNGYDKAPIPIDEPSVDVRIESDIPVDVYVMKDDQYTGFESSGIPSEYEESFTYVTSRSFNYDAHGTLIQWVVVVNHDPSLTANVTVEFEVGEGIDAACCGSSVFAGMAILIGAVAVINAMKRR